MSELRDKVADDEAKMMRGASMAGDDEPTQQETAKPSTSRDTELLLRYFDHRFKALERKIEWSLFWAVLLLLVLLVPGFLESIANAIIRAIAMLAALIAALFHFASG